MLAWPVNAGQRLHVHASRDHQARVPVAALVQRGRLQTRVPGGPASAVVAVADADEDAAAVRAVHQVLDEPIPQGGRDWDTPATRLGLGRHLTLVLVPAALDVDHAGGEVDVLAVQRHQLAAAQA